VIRATLFLTLALTIGTGESATLLCQTLCDGAVAAEGAGADECRHNGSAAQLTVTNDLGCAGTNVPTTAAIRDETHRPARAAQDEATAVSVSNGPPAAPPVRAFAHAAASLTIGNRPRLLALRI
jgi:hypothetical protein